MSTDPHRTVTDGPPDASRSDAWQAADAAFPVSNLPVTPAHKAVVIVRRTRVSSHTATTLEQRRPAPADINDTGKAPRVFRVETAPPLDEGGPLSAVGSGLASADEGDGGDHVPVPRGMRIRANTRPGPLLQVFRAEPSASGAAGTGGTAALDDDREHPSLVDALASIEPIFEAIRRAQSLRFIHDSFALDWCRLSQQADQIQRDIAAAGARQPSAPA